MIASPRLLLLILTLSLAWLAVLVWPALLYLWWFSLGLLSVVTAVDGWRSQPGDLRLTRQYPPRVFQQEAFTVHLVLENHSERSLQLQLHDCYPGSFHVAGLPQTLHVPATAASQISYQLTAPCRGRFSFAAVQARLASPWRLWQRQVAEDLPGPVEVYPYRYADQGSALVLPHNHGRPHHQRSDEGSEFRQLRDYQRGDDPRHIDWKRTAKLRQLISREYDPQQALQLVLVLDRSFRMRESSAALTLFDHALAAACNLAAAMHRRDLLAIYSPGNSPLWIPPRPASDCLHPLRQASLTLDAEEVTLDLPIISRELQRRLNRPAAILLLTAADSRMARDDFDALAALARHHSPLLIMLQNPRLNTVLQQPLGHFHDALEILAAGERLQAQQLMQQQLQQQGIPVHTCLPQQLRLTLLQQYQQAKSVTSQ